MSAQHTPGPWVIEDGWLQNERGAYNDGQYLSICMSATRLSDGALITAAPMLLEGAQDTVEALKLLRVGLTNGVIDAAKMIEVIDAHIDELAYAISKATGQ